MQSKKHKRSACGAMGAVLVASALLAGCDVTNPGPVQDEFIALTPSQLGLINGARRNIAVAVGNQAYTTAMLAREIYPGGQTGAWGHSVTTQGGHLLPGEGPSFTGLHTARFIAETAVKRFKAVGASDERLFQAHLWTAISYRYLGEWWCEAVLPSTDPDVREPGAWETTTQGYFQRAVDNFTTALQYATTDAERHAARAGRAQAYVWLGNWSGAAQDAALVPDNFRLITPMDDQLSALYNPLYEANSGTFRSYTVRFTWFYDYYDQTGDPRTQWGVDPNFSVAVGSLSGFPGGRVPYNPQRKYTSRASAVNLSSGWEMRLIEAEAKLQSGDWQGAMILINRVRTRNVSNKTGVALAPWQAGSLAEAWTYLKRERFIELWLEGRRMGDERRWAANNTPGSTDTPGWENPSHPGYTPIFTANPRSFCFDIPQSERDLNPNVPANTGG